MKILVTGGAGFIGSNLVEFLLKEGHSVRVLDNFSTGKKENLEGLKGDLEVIDGSMVDEKTCEKVCSGGIDCVSHQAAFGSVPRSIEHPQLYSSNNLHGFVNIANQARLAGVKNFVYASSSSVYGDLEMSPKVEEKTGIPLSPYAASKAANEIFAHAFSKCYPMTFIGLRYFNVFGPKQDPEGQYAAVIPLFVKHLIKNQSPTIFSDGEQSRDFTYIQDVVLANYRALSGNTLKGSLVYNIGAGRSTSVNTLFKTIAGILKSEISPVYAPPRKGDVRDSLACITAAKRDLGLTDSVKLEDGLKITVEWFKKYFSQPFSKPSSSFISP